MTVTSWLASSRLQRRPNVTDLHRIPFSAPSATAAKKQPAGKAPPWFGIVEAAIIPGLAAKKQGKLLIVNRLALEQGSEKREKGQRFMGLQRAKKKNQASPQRVILPLQTTTTCGGGLGCLRCPKAPVASC